MNAENIEFSKRTVKRIIKSETGMRVSEDAGILLGGEIQDYGTRIAELADEFAESADRKTVRKTDIRKAIRQLQEQ